MHANGSLKRLLQVDGKVLDEFVEFTRGALTYDPKDRWDLNAAGISAYHRRALQVVHHDLPDAEKRAQHKEAFHSSTGHQWVV